MTFVQKIFKSKTGRKTKTWQIFFNCFAMSLLLLIAVVYLLQANTGISYCLEMEKANQQLKVLKIENERLIKETSGLSSMANIYKVVQGLKMVKVDQADYLIPTQEILAEAEK